MFSLYNLVQEKNTYYIYKMKYSMIIPDHGWWGWESLSRSNRRRCIDTGGRGETISREKTRSSIGTFLPSYSPHAPFGHAWPLKARERERERQTEKRERKGDVLIIVINDTRDRARGQLVSFFLVRSMMFRETSQNLYAVTGGKNIMVDVHFSKDK